MGRGLLGSFFGGGLGGGGGYGGSSGGNSNLGGPPHQPQGSLFDSIKQKKDQAMEKLKEFTNPTGDYSQLDFGNQGSA